MAYALPVIATPRCGEVVTDNVDGLIIPAADSEALANAISQLSEQRDRCTAMAEAALSKSKQFTLARIGEALQQIG